MPGCRAIRQRATPAGGRARAGLERLARGFRAYCFAGALFDSELVDFELLVELADLALLETAFFFEADCFL
jgi:hypothetical protein